MPDFQLPSMLPEEDKNLILEQLSEILKNGKLPADPSVATLLTLAAVRQLVGETARTRNTLRNIQWFVGGLTATVGAITTLFINHIGGIIALFK
jgi:hypothetical protein